MKVAIAGGHGKIALRLARILRDDDHEVLSLVRKEEHFADVEAAGGRPVLCDLEQDEAKELAEAVGSVDAVVFAAGAGPGSGPERKWTVDYAGAVKLIEAARINNISRYLMVSAVGADPNAPGDDTFGVYIQAKGKADEDLMRSGLEYTIVRPTRLTDDPGDERVRVGEPAGSIPRDDVAAVLAASLQEPSTIDKLFVVTDGDDPIEEALRSL